MKKILTTAAVLICAALFACSCGSKKNGKREGASGSLKSGSYGEESDDAQEEERRKISDWWTSEDPASSAAQDPGNDEEGAAPDDKKDASNDDSSRRQDGEGKELPAGGGESWTKDY